MNIEILDLVTYFILYSFLGWVLESICKTIWEKKFVNSGFLNGPFCPIYGAGAIIMLLFLSGSKNNIVLLFFAGFFVLSIWEYIVGWALEKIFHTRYWDYTQNRFNIQGRVCLLNSFYWGIMGVIFIHIVQPFVEVQIHSIEPNILLYVVILLSTYLIVDAITSIIKVKQIDIKLRTLKEMGENIREKLEEIKAIGEEQAKQHMSKEALQELVEELKQKQAVLRRKLYRQTIRLKKAFPTMKSESISEFLSQKFEIGKIDKSKKKIEEDKKRMRKNGKEKKE